VGDGAAHRLQHGQRPRERCGIAAHHDRKAALGGAFDTAADRAVEHLDAGGASSAALYRAVSAETVEQSIRI